VVPGEDSDKGTVDCRRPARPGGKPESNFLEAAKRTWWLRQLRVALACDHQRPSIRAWQIAQKCPEIVERQA
jgi:hypothetical protein